MPGGCCAWAEASRSTEMTEQSDRTCTIATETDTIATMSKAPPDAARLLEHLSQKATHFASAKTLDLEPQCYSMLKNRCRLHKNTVPPYLVGGRRLIRSVKGDKGRVGQSMMHAPVAELMFCFMHKTCGLNLLLFSRCLQFAG